jgi:predicted NBD/HSP70 family sugar kinase
VLPRQGRVVAAINPELDVIDVALVTLGGELIARRRVAVSVPTVVDTVTATAAAVRELLAEHPEAELLGAGIAVPGLVRSEDGYVRLAPHLEWREEPLAELLAAALRVAVVAANDAHLGCRAELTFGAGVGADSLLYVNGGPSGIGGGIVIDGRPVGGSAGYAGEIGHLSVDADGPRCACGAHGCLESLVSRDALTAVLGIEHPDDDELELALARAVGGEEGGRGPVSTEVERQMRWLGVALRGVVNLLNPELVVLGGHLAALWTAASPEARAAVLTDALSVSAEGVRIEVAALGSQRLLVGAAELAWDVLIADPLSVGDAA